MSSVGLLVVGSQVGSVSWTFRVGGVRREPWVWSEGGPPIRELEPVRKTKSGRLSRNIPVQAVSVTTQGWLYLESGLEHELATWLDRKPEVVWLLGQPVLLGWEDGISHYPDLLSLDGDGRVTIWDARPPQGQDETFLAVSVRTRAACEAVGWGYELFGGLPEVESLNLRWVAGARRPPQWLFAAQAALHTLLQHGPQTVAEVMEADGGRGYLVSAMWHLVWTGQVRMDFGAPWGRSTPISWAEEGTL